MKESNLLPYDLAKTLGEFPLLAKVIKAVSEAEPQWPTTPFASGGQAFPAPLLASLLVYSYATGRYGSQDIEQALHISPALRYLCRGQYPNSSTLRQFRRRYADVLQRILAEVFREILNAATPAPLLPVVVEKTALAEAQVRLHRAILTDTAQADE